MQYNDISVKFTNMQNNTNNEIGNYQIQDGDILLETDGRM